jgi:hypothetical protein
MSEANCTVCKLRCDFRSQAGPEPLEVRTPAKGAKRISQFEPHPKTWRAWRAWREVVGPVAHSVATVRYAFG